jgi:hypothetical protein
LHLAHSSKEVSESSAPSSRSPRPVLSSVRCNSDRARISFIYFTFTCSLTPFCRARGLEYHIWSHLPEPRPIPLRTVLPRSLSTTLSFRVLPLIYVMPTASSTRSARVTRSARMTATARPISTSVGSARRPAVSMMTCVAATEVPVTAGLPGTDKQS